MQSSRSTSRSIPTREQLHVWGAFLRYHATVVDILGQELDDAVGLPLTWYDVLAQLAVADGGRRRMQDLADAIVLSRSGLTRLVDRLEAQGLVERAECPSDRRGTFASITAAGRARLEEARPVHRAGIAEHFGTHVAPEDLAVLRRVFDDLVTGVDRS